MSIGKLNRTAFKAQSTVQASKHFEYYKNLSWKERLRIAGYLNSVAFNYDPNNPPKMNKQAFKVRSLKHG